MMIFLYSYIHNSYALYSFNKHVLCLYNRHSGSDVNLLNTNTNAKRKADNITANGVRAAWFAYTFPPRAVTVNVPVLLT